MASSRGRGIGSGSGSGVLFISLRLVFICLLLLLSAHRAQSRPFFLRGLKHARTTSALHHHHSKPPERERERERAKPGGDAGFACPGWESDASSSPDCAPPAPSDGDIFGGSKRIIPSGPDQLHN